MAESLDGKYDTSDEYRRSIEGSRMSDSLSMACDYHYDPFCEVCAKTRKRNVQHEGFCKECVQFLCKDCLNVHRNLEGTRGHVIGRGDDMPKSMADKPPKFDYCDVHLRSRKDQFCGTHRVLLCNQCVPLQHKDCPVQSVDDACKGVPTSEIDVFYDQVNDFKTNLSAVVAQIELNVTGIGKQSEDLLKDAQDLKDKAIEKIEKLFHEMTSEIKSTSNARTSELRHDKNKLSDVIGNLEETLDEINKMKGSTVDTKMFLGIQNILKDVDKCKSDAEKLRPSSMDVKMSFIPDKKIQEFLSASTKMGSISLDTSQPNVAISVPEISFPISPVRSLPLPLSQMKANKLGSYNVKLDNDKNDCDISCMTITNDGRRLLADYKNCKIKMFSRDMTSLCSLSLSTQPWDIAVTGDRAAVVSCADEEKLLILDISARKMSIKGTVQLPFTVGGIAPYKDKLLVISWSPSSFSVKLIDQSGRVYWSTHTDQQGQQLFSWPQYVTCYDAGGSAAVIVSDWGNHTLTVLNADTGDVIARRQVKEKSPHGVTTDTAGNIYVCYYSTDEVGVLSKDLSQDKVLMSTRDGLSGGPRVIVYDAVEHQLLLSYYPRETIDCFKLQ